MMQTTIVLGCVLALGLAATTCVAEAPSQSEEVQRQETVPVLDVLVISTNRIMLGTNAMNLAAATNHMARHREYLDVIALHGSVTGEASVGGMDSAMARLGRIGVPWVVIEEDGELAWRENSGADGVRALTVSTGQFAALRRLWTRPRAATGQASAPTLQTTIQWDTSTGTYGLNRVELGLFGKSVWLIHEQRETDDGTGTVGIQFKKAW